MRRRLSSLTKSAAAIAVSAPAVACPHARMPVLPARPAQDCLPRVRVRVLACALTLGQQHLAVARLHVSAASSIAQVFASCRIAAAQCTDAVVAAASY